MEFKGYKLDPFQEQAIEHLNNGKSVIVAAPTGAGKTLVAEYAVDQAIRKREQIIYTAPLKALSNQKYRDFGEQYPGKVGIVTGDVSHNVTAPVVIMTTEIFRNAIFDSPQRLDNVRFVVFDEIHFLDDIERGTVWEESIIFAPQHLRFISLSATVPNLREMAGWMNEVRDAPVEMIECRERPVPLRHFFLVERELIDDLKHWNRARGNRRRNRPKRGGRDPLLDFIRDNDDAPCLYFAFNRARCEQLAKQSRWLDLLDQRERKDILRLYDELAGKYGIDASPQYAAMRPLIAHGVAYHHAGMLPSMKEVVERLFNSRLLKLIFTTSTFALGINMPAKTVVFDELTKFNGVDFAPLMTREYYQMAGRAGRRGMDEEGLVYSKIDTRDINRNQVRDIVFGRPEPVMSQFNSCYATVLNLYESLGEGVSETYNKSFHAYRAGKRRQRRAREQLELKVKLLKELGYIDGAGLTAKGQCAARLYGHELVATELIFGGVFDGLDARRLAVLTMGVLFDGRTSSDLPSQDRRAAGDLIAKVRGALAPVQNLEAKLGLDDMSPRPNFALSAVTKAWAMGAPFEQLLRMTQTPEGHIVRHFRRCILLMRQIITVAPNRPELQSQLMEAIRAINRDVVDAERQLRASVS